jgi:glycosyltransferase involved in cell wall biosynthesis
MPLVNRRPVRILELRSVFGTGGGPEKTILLGTARTDPARYAVTVCYVRDDRDTVFGIDDWAASLPITYREIRERHSFDPAPFGVLRRLVRDERFDIVHAHDYKTDAMAWFLARTTSATPLATAHGWTGHSAKERRVYYPLDRWLMRRFPRVIAVSSEIKRVLVAGGAVPDRVTVVTNGIDGDRFRRDPERAPAIRAALGMAPHHVVIGAVGRLEPQKNFPLLLRVFAGLAAGRHDLRLVVAGDGSLRGALQQQVDALQLGTRCVLTGHRTDVADLYQGFDLYVQSSDYEGTPNTVLEAMALEAPVVATAAGGTEDIARDGQDAWIVPVRDEAALTHALTDALARPDERARRAASARRRVETDLSFDTRMRRVEAIYDELMAARGARQ